MAATQKNRFLAITTTLGPDELLLKSVSIVEPLGRLFQIEAELLSEKSDVDFDVLIGSNVTIRLTTPSGETRFFNGFISRFVQTGNDRSFVTYRAVIVPWMWLLTRTADCRIFQKKKVPEIIEAVFKAHGFKDYKLKLSATYREWEYCVQYRETDFNFVSRLMEQEGIYYYFEHADGVHTLILIDSAGAHETLPGRETLNYRPRTQRTDEHSETVTDWMIEREIQPGLWALADYNFKTPAGPIRVNANVSRGHEHAGFEVYDYPGEFANRQEGEAYAKLRIQEVQSQYEVIRGQATVRSLATGYTFTLKGHFRADQNRAYLVTSTSLQASVGDFESGKSGEGEFFTCGFTAIPALDPFRSARTTPKPLIQGPQTAVVAGRAGEEIDPDEFGRIKVQFHWDRQGKRDENSSCWIRVSHAVAGKSWGGLFTPRIGQEVVVEFLEGDPDCPLITGVVYNAAQTVPYPLPEHKTISTLKSSSTPGGQGFNEVRFEDKRGDEQIFIHAEKNQDVRVKNDRFESIGHDQHLTVVNDQFEHVKNDRDEIVDRDQKEVIGRDLHQKIVGKEAKEVGESLSLKVKGNMIEVFDKNHSEQCAKDYFLKADNVVIEAGTNLTLKVGSTFIAIESSGITISAPDIELKAKSTLTATANASASIESSGPAKLKGLETTLEGSTMTTIKGGMVKIN